MAKNTKYNRYNNSDFYDVVCKDCKAKVGMRQKRKWTRCDSCCMKYQQKWRKDNNRLSFLDDPKIPMDYPQPITLKKEV